MCAFVADVLQVSVEGFNETDESELVNQITELLKSCTLKETNKIIELVKLEQHGVELVEVEKDHSIGLFFHCRSYEALQYLYNLLISLRLQDIIQTVFNNILDREKQVVVNIKWNQEDYSKCEDYFQFGRFYTRLCPQIILYSVSLCLTKRTVSY